MEDFYDILMDWCQNMARGIDFFPKTFFRVIFLEEYILPPSRIFYNYRIFNILQSFSTFHFSLIREKKREQRYCPSVRHLAPYRTLPTRNAHAITPAHYPGGAMIDRRDSRLAPYRAPYRPERLFGHRCGRALTLSEYSSSTTTHETSFITS